VTSAGGFNFFQQRLKEVKKMTLSMFRKRPIVKEQFILFISYLIPAFALEKQVS